MRTAVTPRGEAATHPESGFTLVEVLVSLFIFALIAAGTMAAMFQTIAAKDRLDAADARMSRLHQARAVISTDLNSLILRDVRDGLGGWEEARATTDGEALFTFTRTGRINPTRAPRGDLQRVAYHFRDGQLIRTALPHENPAQIEDGRSRVLIENLSDARVELLLPGERNGDIQRLSAWRAPRTAGAAGVQTVPEVRALSLQLTDLAGETTEHLFELPL